MQAMAAIVLHPSDHPFPTVFGLCANAVVAMLNSRVLPPYHATVRREDRLRWTILGSKGCDFIEVRLDQSFLSFEMESLLPTPARITCSTAGCVEACVLNALSELFAAQECSDV